MKGKGSKLDGKTSKPGFNKESGADRPKPQRNYSHKQLIEKIDRYASVAKTGKQLKDVLDIKSEYVGRNLKKAENRSVRNNHYRLGARANIHPRETIENLRQQDRQHDQSDRNRVAGEVKAYAHRNYAPSQVFNAHARERPKDRPLDKG